MSVENDIELLAHLLRRAGFGADRNELEELVSIGYENVVEGLVNPPDEIPVADEHFLHRRMPYVEVGGATPMPGAANWLFHMMNTQRVLEEKMTLFWHQIFATANSKIDNDQTMSLQIHMFRENSLGNYRDLLIKLARDPAMIFWLDNNENHKRAPNENWGRELLELFSLGVGNYTEEDVYECARAFTGWTIRAKIPRQPYNRFPWNYQFRPEEHDFGEKTFLGRTGDFNGEDIIDIILEQPACPRFIARHLYNFFVADEPPVSAWQVESPLNPEAIEILAGALVESDFEIKPVLRTLFNSKFFKDSMYSKVKSPVEVIVGTLRATGELLGPDPRLVPFGQYPEYMGQGLHNPPSVEGWHSGKEWVNTGSVVKRINFVADHFSNVDLPGVQNIAKYVTSAENPIGPELLVERCLLFMGPVRASEETLEELIEHARKEGELCWNNEEEYLHAVSRIADLLALIGSTIEYQYC